MRSSSETESLSAARIASLPVGSHRPEKALCRKLDYLSLLLAVGFAGCFGGLGDKCNHQRLYEGNRISSGTITYGESGVTDGFGCAGPSDSAK
jgi:hypothetical protein